MKNSKDYSKKLLKLYRSLKKKYPGVEKITYEDPIEALVYAIVSEHVKDKQAMATFKQFGDYFIDYNDLRVSRTDDIVEMIGQDTPAMHEVAADLTKALRNVFNVHHKVSLDALKKIGKRPAKSALEKIEGVSKFVVDYCMLTALEGHAIPLTSTMVEYLRDNELVYPGADEQEIGGFLAKQVSAKNGYEFYDLLRRESESKIRKKKKKTTKKKVKKAVKTGKKATKVKKKTKTKTKKKTKKKAATKKKKKTKKAKK
jgi:endonuclease III